MASYGLTSLGLWRRRKAFQALLGESDRVRFTPSSIATAPDTYIGWGGKPSGERARAFAEKNRRSLLLVEDGFLCSFRPGRREFKHSYVLDSKGMHFDSASSSDMHNLILNDVFSSVELTRARRCIDQIRSLKLSKYNHYPDADQNEQTATFSRPYVIIVEQVAGDASLPREVPLIDLYKQMLATAIAEYPDTKLVIRAHPACREESLLQSLATQAGYQSSRCPGCNIWDAIEGAEAVFTISSHVGFEALMADKKVHTFGTPFYAGWQLTTDHHPEMNSRGESTPDKLFAAAYMRQSRYLDAYTSNQCEIEMAIEQLATIADSLRPNRARVHTVNFSPWRRRVLAPFLVGADGPARHHSSLRRAEECALRDDGIVALWGAKLPPPENANYCRIEDGLVRSKGLGADLYRPYSICVDDEFLYFDTRGESRLERLIKTAAFPAALLERAKTLRTSLIDQSVTKYESGKRQSQTALPKVEANRLKVLVPGQVIDDASIVLGNSQIRDNHALTRETRLRFPDAFIVFKNHPDVAAKLRDGGKQPSDADLNVSGGDISAWIDWADRIETISSLSGFEALLRGRTVGVYGTPFYAGWGLTEDYGEETDRGLKRNIDQLVAASLILYPRYIHPKSLLPCSPEKTICDLADQGSSNYGAPNLDAILRRLVARVLRIFSGIRHP